VNEAARLLAQTGPGVRVPLDETLCPERPHRVCCLRWASDCGLAIALAVTGHAFPPCCQADCWAGEVVRWHR